MVLKICMLDVQMKSPLSNRILIQKKDFKVTQPTPQPLNMIMIRKYWTMIMHLNVNVDFQNAQIQTENVYSFCLTKPFAKQILLECIQSKAQIFHGT